MGQKSISGERIIEKINTPSRKDPMLTWPTDKQRKLGCIREPLFHTDQTYETRMVRTPRQSDIVHMNMSAGAHPTLL